MSFAAIASTSSWVSTDRSAFLCKYWRRSRFVFSFVPRCQGWCGSQKNTGIDNAAVITAWLAISRPRSQVNDLRMGVGSVAMCSINAAATVSALYPSGSATTIV